MACQVHDNTVQAVPGLRMETGSAATSGTPVPLPFDSQFDNRWNEANDGSPYEPCVAFTESELERFNIDSRLVEDAALVDGQGVRGCRWFMRDKFAIGQVVTDSASLPSYRRATPELDWKADLRIDGREVGLFGLNDDNETCSTYVQSYDAAVVTNVVTSTSDEGQKIDPCKLVQDFTRAYIDKIPN